jgi:transketolase
MIEITLPKARIWSRIGPRATYGQAVLECASERDDFYVLTADLAQSSGLFRFKEVFPERFVNVGIAEQNMLGIAAGLAKDGFHVFASSFAPFITMRACEQVRMDMGYMQLDITTVGIGSGIGLAQQGNSHYGIEDVSVMRAIPGMTIVNPADGVEIVKAVEALCDYGKPAYLRLTGVPGFPMVHKGDIDFKIGKAITLREGDDIAIVAAGTMVSSALQVAEILSRDEGIEATVADMHTIKPIDTDVLDAQLDKKLVVTLEEATIVGGLGGAVAEYFALKKNKPAQLMLGIRDTFLHAGSYPFLLEQCRLTVPQIVSDIKAAMQ